jgi:hypothetical protein
VDLAGQKWPDIVRETIIGALNTQMIGAQDEIVSIYHRRGVPAILDEHTCVHMQGHTWRRSHKCCPSGPSDVGFVMEHGRVFR